MVHTAVLILHFEVIIFFPFAKILDLEFLPATGAFFLLASTSAPEKCVSPCKFFYLIHALPRSNETKT